MSKAESIRQALMHALPSTANFGEVPDPRSVYVPLAHIKALRLESNLVVGSRGVGKSFWTQALYSSEIRALLGASIRELESLDVHIGFSSKADAAFPDKETFAQLLSQYGYSAYDVWRAVVVRWLAQKIGQSIACETWADSVNWVRQQPEQVATILRKADLEWQSVSRKGLIVFDALDQSSDDWRVMDSIVRDLLRVVLWLKSSSSIQAKVFLREDQFARTVTNFPDASKLLATKAELIWQPHDLHGLLWQLLCNSPGGELFRQMYRDIFQQLPIQRGEHWLLPDELRRDTPQQRALFASLAGQWMGKDRRRGVPYVWSVSHLADGKGRTSPRSFLVAIRAAAEDSSEKYLEYPLALHYESIKRGVQRASAVRIDEMAEDYSWITVFFKPLAGMNVPCEFSAIADRWGAQFADGPVAVPSGHLPPQYTERGWLGVRDDLERLGLLETMRDGRINMPDLYRVGFGLGRHGGVKPVK